MKIIIYAIFPFIVLWHILSCIFDIVIFNPFKTLLNGLKYLPYALSLSIKSQFKNLRTALKAAQNNCSFQSQLNADFVNNLKPNYNKDEDN